MTEKRKLSMPHIYTSILYICGLLLFMEWLYPVEQITDTDSISIFLIYAILCFFISMIQMKWWLSFLVKGFGLVFILNGLYFDAMFLSPAWFNQFMMEIMINTDVVLSQEWYYFTPLFRSMLFLLLIWLMSYLLHYWFVQMKRIFLFIILTFIYIAVLDTFTLYDATSAIVRTFVVSLVALAMANFSRDIEKERITFQWVKKAPIWMLPLVLTIMFSVAVGFLAPKLEPQWPDPVPFIQSAAEQVSGGGNGRVQKVGYGEDDSRLGGSFVQDDSPVFYAEAGDAHYWRVETRDVYTGRGWESSNESDEFYQLDPQSLHLYTFQPTVESEELTAKLTFASEQTIPKLVYPYGLQAITEQSSPANYFLDPISEAIETRAGGSRIGLDTYTLTYNNPSFSLTALQNSTEEALGDEGYLQLPDSLPNRVQELAEEITGQYESRYDKVRAIERYFSGNGYTYETTDVAVPGIDDDYVDQFLFETKAGYCDNFSTAMVVMLRSLDIPARWAKGFTSGELVEPGAGDELDVYEVTNANAHSWVEVYFADAGWVSFEPTQGFSNPTEFHADSSESNTENQDDVLEAPERDIPESDVELEEEEVAAAIAEPKEGGVEVKGWHIAIAVLVLFITTFILFKQRYRLMTKFYAVRLGRNPNEKTFHDAYHHLLRVLNHYGFEREANQTLREYSRRIDVRYSTQNMQLLTNQYELLLYRKEFNQTELQRLTKLWENLLNKIMG
ncbi:DUF3488 and DUF4129 domain-containing transglutaminase family protein [Oceanobacillus sp. FSL H7-0719]|uniref:transglutaminase TgpA family protein n=1 Tax=Oceanobacillus sp. FSL H7-0719 TaxID=2954507 RepID=UPI00324D3D41